MGELISVIIPVYNSEEYLEKCIQSILSQTYIYFEVLLINDGSTDASLEKCLYFENMDSRIRVINKENGGVSSARNRGLKEAKGKYVCFIDSDDYIDKTYLQILYNGMEQDNDIDCAIASYSSVVDGKDNIFSVNAGIYNSRDILVKAISKNTVCFALWNKLFSMEIIKAKKLSFDCRIANGEDYLFVCQYLAKCRKIYMDERVLYYYIRRESSACFAREMRAAFDEKWLSEEIALQMLKDENIKDNSIEQAIDYAYFEFYYMIIKLMVHFNYYNDKYKECKRNFRKLIRKNKNLMNTINMNKIHIYALAVSPILYFKLKEMRNNIINAKKIHNR